MARSSAATRRRPRRAPGALRPQLATLVDAAPDGEGWLHEIKYDGYRLLALVDGHDVRLITRNGKDWTDRYPAVATALTGLPAESCMLDGEVVVVAPDGTTSFQALQNVMRHRPEAGTLQYYVFDLLELDEEDVAQRPLDERKAVLEVLLGGLDGDVVRYGDHVEGQGPRFFDRACTLGLEGIISKRRAAPYQPGRSRDWVKVKCVQEQEFVIVGFTDPQGSRTAFGALLLAAHDGAGRLVGVGKVGTGFDEALLRSLYARLKPLEVATSPISNPPRGAALRGVHWVRPELVAEIGFTALTDDLNLRHPVFRGLREDKPAAEVGIETPQPTPEDPVATKKARPAKQASPKRERAPKRASAKRERAPKEARSARPARTTTSRGKQRVEIGGVSLSSPDKVLYADAAVTKADLARYYESIAEWILPHIENRPLTLVRCPSGYDDCFYQKHIDESAPDVIRRVAIPGDSQPYGAVDSISGVIALVQLGVLELHTWGARRDRVERPDRIVIDLDPDPSVGWERVVEGAQQVRQAFALLELESFVKTTGGKGLHVVVPFRRGPDWDEVKAFSRAVAEAVSAASPGRYTLNISKAKRRGKVLIDYLRNGMGATAIEAYSTRARPGAPVAVPLAWDELGPDVREDHFNVGNVPDRLKKLKRDPWKEYAAVKQSITAALRKQVGSL